MNSFIHYPLGGAVIKYQGEGVEESDKNRFKNLVPTVKYATNIRTLSLETRNILIPQLYNVSHMSSYLGSTNHNSVCI